jgi:hypothetical protein
MALRARHVLALLAGLLFLYMIYGRREIDFNSKIDVCLDAGGCWLHKSMKCELDSQDRCDEEQAEQ